MTLPARGSIVMRILGILVCGVAGGMAGWSAVDALGWDGVLGALVAAVIGMVVATALWTAGTTLVRGMRRTR